MTDAPIFLTLDEVLRLHSYQIEHFGGDIAIRDLALLESALAQPQQSFGGQFLHPDLASMAAAYLFHIVQNHPFVDGNKRTGTHAAIVFLEINDRELDLPTNETEAIVLQVAQGKIGKDEVTIFFRNQLKTD